MFLRAFMKVILLIRYQVMVVEAKNFHKVDKNHISM